MDRPQVLHSTADFIRGNDHDFMPVPRVRDAFRAFRKSDCYFLGAQTPGGKRHGFEFPDEQYFTNAYQLVNEIKSINPDICIGGACYPEIHPESKNRVEDIEYLKQKVDCGVEFLTSQMFFDNDKFLNFVEMCRIKGINVPIIAGIMPITNANQIKRSIELSNCSVPDKFFRIMDRFGDDPDKMKQAGIIYATEQIIDLMANGINNIHIYTMNKPDVACAIMNGLSQIINE